MIFPGPKRVLCVDVRTETGMIRVGDGIVASPQIAQMRMSIDELRALAGLSPLPSPPEPKGPTP